MYTFCQAALCFVNFPQILICKNAVVIFDFSSNLH